MKRGLKHMRMTKNIGLKALFKVANVSQSEITEESIGFSIAPRINAVGRLEDATPAVHLYYQMILRKRKSWPKKLMS